MSARQPRRSSGLPWRGTKRGASAWVQELSDESSALAEVEVVTSRKGRALATVRVEVLPIEGGLKPAIIGLPDIDAATG